MKFIHKDNKVTLVVDREEVGYLAYDLKDGLLYLESTVVYPDHRNNGYAEKLVDEIARYAREHNLKTIPVCSYIVAKYKTGGYEDIDGRQ